MNDSGHWCPVCGYDALEAPPENHTICPSCGTQFGLDTTFHTIHELRQRWLAMGALWWSEFDIPPAGWDGHRQVRQVERYSGGSVTDDRDRKAARVVPAAAWSYAVG